MFNIILLNKLFIGEKVNDIHYPILKFIPKQGWEVSDYRLCVTLNGIECFCQHDQILKMASQNKKKLVRIILGI